MDINDPLQSRRLVVVSNRLPVVVQGSGKNAAIIEASGGLVTAMVPILQERKGLWMGWPGVSSCSSEEIGSMLEQFEQKVGYSLCPVELTSEEVSLYYDGFSNEIIWPLFHDLHSSCHFSHEYWEGYKAVNEKFAEELIKIHRPDDFIWIHDYHLILLAQKLRRAGVKTNLAFFLHIPFAAMEIFMKIPWRFEILRALLEFDFIGFQTRRDHRNFLQCVNTLLKDVTVKSSHHLTHCRVDGRDVQVGTFPISIDYQEFNISAAAGEVSRETERIRESLNQRKIVFSIDRLDYTKGIPNRLEAIREFLRVYPEMHERVTFIQVVIPSRIDIPEYAKLKHEIDKSVSEINSEFTTSGWVPIHYIFHSLSRRELLAYYRSSDVMLVTPLKDGMNLVGKEFIASRGDEDGVLIISEFAGAACQLKDHALVINPYDIMGMASAINDALKMPLKERNLRMRKLRRSVRTHDIYRWALSILKASGAGDISSIVPSDEYVPTEQWAQAPRRNLIE